MDLTGHAPLCLGKEEKKPVSLETVAPLETGFPISKKQEEPPLPPVVFPKGEVEILKRKPVSLRQWQAP